MPKKVFVVVAPTDQFEPRRHASFVESNRHGHGAKPQQAYRPGVAGHLTVGVEICIGIRHFAHSWQCYRYGRRYQHIDMAEREVKFAGQALDLALLGLFINR